VTLGGIGAVAWTNYVPPLTECLGTVGGGLELLIRSEAHIFPIALLAKIPEPDEQPVNGDLVLGGRFARDQYHDGEGHC
jgi:hypothetical protein